MNEGFSRTVRGATFIAQNPSRFATKERILRTRKISSALDSLSAIFSVDFVVVVV
jgi:hypothetical protein